MRGRLYVGAATLVVAATVASAIRGQDIPVDNTPVSLTPRIRNACRKLPIDWKANDAPGNRRRVVAFIRERMEDNDASAMEDPSRPQRPVYLLNPIIRDRHIDVLLYFYVDDPQPSHRRPRPEGDSLVTLGWTGVVTKVQQGGDVRLIEIEFNEQVGAAPGQTGRKRDEGSDQREQTTAASSRASVIKQWFFPQRRKFIETWRLADDDIRLIRIREVDLVEEFKASSEKLSHRAKVANNMQERIGWSYPEPNADQRASKPNPTVPKLLRGTVTIGKEKVPGFDAANPAATSIAIQKYRDKRRRYQQERYRKKHLAWRGGNYRLHYRLGAEHEDIALRFTVADPFPWHRRAHFDEFSAYQCIGWSGVVCDVKSRGDEEIVVVGVQPLFAHRTDPRNCRVDYERFLETWRVTEDELELLSFKKEGAGGLFFTD